MGKTATIVAVLLFYTRRLPCNTLTTDLRYLTTPTLLTLKGLFEFEVVGVGFGEFLEVE